MRKSLEIGLKRLSPCVILGMTLVGILVASCSGDDGDTAGVGEACQIDADCDQGLLCRAQQCVEPSGPTNNTPNGNNQAGNNNNDEIPDVIIEAEDYFVSYLLENTHPNTQAGERRFELRLYSTQDETDVIMNPETIECGGSNECIASDDLAHFIYTRASSDEPGMNDVFLGTIGDDLTVEEASSALVSNVRNVRLDGDILSYYRHDNGMVRAYYREIPGGNETSIAVMGNVGSTEGSLHIDPVSRKVIAYRTTLYSMDISVGDLGQDNIEKVFTINAENFQGQTGSHFGGIVPTTISPDGRYLSLLTVAPNDYGRCADSGSLSAPECTGPGQRCGQSGRCTAYEVTLHFLDLENLNNLGEHCDSSDACGEVHTCDVPSPTEYDVAQCIPKRVVMGLPVEPYQGQPSQNGCDLTSDNPDYLYTNVRAPIQFGPDGYLYAVAGRRCTELNIERTAIVKIHPVTGSKELIFGNTGEDFDESRCYNSAERRVDVSDCIIHIENARLTPGGNEIVFLATNPDTVQDPNLAGRLLDLWTVKRNGEGQQWIGGHGLTHLVRSYRVHPTRE